MPTFVARCLAIACAVTALPAVGACPDYITAAHPPALAGPVKKPFASVVNHVLAARYQPWHMAHDAIVKAGTAATIRAKFDYDPVLHKDLEAERVHVYLYGTGMARWQYVGNYLTDSDGKIDVPLGTQPVGEYVVRFVVEGDLSSTSGYLSVVEPGRDTIVFDIDGTLTTSDFEAYADYAGVKTATPYRYAPEMVNAWRDKGYQLIFLSARPYWVTRDGRAWLGVQGIAPWHYHSNPYSGGPVPPDTQKFKGDYVRHLRDAVGLNLVRVYGNALTDIGAYADAGMAKADTYIIGPHAGVAGTRPVHGEYGEHYRLLVEPAPLARCRADATLPAPS
ncbi:lipin/Ned1/Smp2 family protein [Massilia rubra]|uniref:Haloacid dehalogenase n=1 Tax=Massilia rubra TaxID=2607910 RepID=A0ABX0LNJ3_9BURK|nr:haloacid dehalogenase [Massilia rubra]NHZ33797.1 haloacid dehalogenase [Massilia rubra]